MKRIWNALRYGDAETRKCIGSVILFSAAAIGIIAIAGLLGRFYLFVLGMLAGIAAIIVSQTFTLVDDDFVAEINRDGEKDTVKTVTVQKNRVIYGSGNAKKQEKKEQKKRDGFDTDDGKIHAAQFEHYNAVVLKKIKKKYRLKRDHRPIIIDYSKSYRIKECPAFIWRIHNKVYLLLLEKEPRRLSISRDLIRNMGYMPGIKSDPAKEYEAFKKENLVTGVFKEYLPDYYDSKVKNDTLKCKNLYTIYPDICISNRSAADVMDLLYLNFMPQDKITKSEKINGFFKRIYAANILYRDRVYSITEYKEAVEKALGEMCYAEIPEREFVITLENLMKGKFISQEYVDHYKDMRNKIVSNNPH
ncbi:MAG: hypothetical protein HFJ06_05875 [Lachnospiraceae bacterium]|nr:hypothetical protein [Lachnospiraceae bacterium]